MEEPIETEATEGAPTPSAEPPENPSPAEPDNTDDSVDEPGQSANAEAAKWRRKLRDAEDRTSVLESQLEAARRQIVGQALDADGRLTLDDLLLVKPDLSDFLSEEGTIDAELVATAVADILQEKPHWAKPTYGDFGQVAARASAQGVSDWSDALR